VGTNVRSHVVSRHTRVGDKISCPPQQLNGGCMFEIVIFGTIS